MNHFGGTISDIDIPFGRLIVIMLRLLLAYAIACLIFAILILALFAIVTVATGGDLAVIKGWFLR